MKDPLASISPNIKIKDKRTADFIRACLNKPEEERRKKRQAKKEQRYKERQAKVEKVLKQFAKQDAKVKAKEAKRALEARIDRIYEQSKKVLAK